MTQTQQAKHTPDNFGTYLRKQVGYNWVLARRTQRIVNRYGADVVCLTPKRYAKLQRQFEMETYGAPLKAIQDAAPELLAALKALFACFNDAGELAEQAQDQLSVAFEKSEAAIAKAEGR